MKNTISLREQLNYKNFENIIVETAGHRLDVREAAQEIFEAAQELENAILEDDVILEASQALDSKVLQNIFSAASKLSKGETPAPQTIKQRFTGAVGGAAKAVKQKVGNSAVGKMSGKAINAAKKLNQVVDKAAKTLQNTAPVENFDVKVDQLLGKWKETLGADHQAVKLAQQFGEFGKKNPKKTAFVIATLSGLASFAGSPAAGMALGTVLRSAVGVAKGERASTALGKAVKIAGAGAAAGAAAGGLADFFGISGGEMVPAEETQGVEANVASEFDTWRKGMWGDLKGGEFSQTKIGQLIQAKIDSGADPVNVISNLDDLGVEAYGEDPRGMSPSIAREKMSALISHAIMQDAGVNDVSGGAKGMAEVLLKALK